MKPVALFFFLLTAVPCFSQFGCGLSFSQKSATGFHVIFGKKNRLILGGCLQQNGQLPSVKTEREDNYGTTPIRDGDFFWLADIGYSLTIFKHITLNPEFNVGLRRYYTNYEDQRFNGDGYTLVRRSDQIIGAGFYIGYLFSKGLEPFVGYQSQKRTVLGIRYMFLAN